MERVLRFLILFALSHNCDAQESRVNHGVSFAVSGSYQWSQPSGRSVGLEAGYFILKKFGDRGMISLGCRVKSAWIEEQYDSSLVFVNGFSLLDSIRTSEHGQLSAHYFGLAFPFKMRYEVFKKQGLYFLLGITPSFNLNREAKWDYTEVTVNTNSNTILSRRQGLQRNISSHIFHAGFPVLGIGIIRGQFMIEGVFSPETVLLDDDYLLGYEMPVIMLNINYFFKPRKALNAQDEL